jgi:hypothetical protein
MLVPLGMSGLFFAHRRPAPVTEVSAASAQSRRASADGLRVPGPPDISLSVEQSTLTPYAEADAPVVLPGYLLPDDGGEEPSHAGS